MPTDFEKIPDAETGAAMAEANLIITQRRTRFESCDDFLTSLQAESLTVELKEDDRD